MSPSVSIVIPAHNEAKYLPATLTALLDACRQLDVVFEIIVVNDASTDQTAQIAQEMGVSVVDANLRNIGAVRNLGAKQARYDWLVFVDADTIVPLQTLEQTLRALAAGFVGGGAKVDISREKPISWYKYSMYLLVYFGWQLCGRWAAGCYMFCRKEAFDSFGGFDESYFAAEEYFFSRELKKRGKFTLVTHPVVTSARKLHAYSVFQLARFLIRPLFSGRSPFKTKTGLEILYQDPR